MKSLLLISILLWSVTAFSQIAVVEIKGDVVVRHGVQQEWQPIRVGDILKPEDSMRSGKKSSATIVVDGTKRILIPENVIVDLADFRKLTQEELVLKLAMERVRAVPDDLQRNGLVIPQITVMHGSEKKQAEQRSLSTETGELQLNGTRVLYNGGYFATSALRAKEVFRLYPELSSRIDVRLMVASALEKESLNGEALSEYKALSQESLTPKDQKYVQAKIEQLKKHG